MSSAILRAQLGLREGLCGARVSEVLEDVATPDDIVASAPSVYKTRSANRTVYTERNVSPR